MEDQLRDFAPARRRMVEEQLVRRGIEDPRVLAAMEQVPREAFVAPALLSQAYTDHPLNIGEKQTISQPFVVARMSEALGLTGREKVLEIGTGSAYQTAILLNLAGAVYSIERLKLLSQQARKTLFKLGYDGFYLRVGDGSCGWPEAAPFAAIVATAAAPAVPPPLAQQLAEGGRLVIPIGSVEEQELMLYKKQNGQLVPQSLGACRFVKFIGKYAWPEE